MRNISIYITSFLFILASQYGTAHANKKHVSCTHVKECINLIPTTAKLGSGLSSSEIELALAIQKFGKESIPYLIDMLKSNDEDIRSLVSYTLRDIDGLTEKELPFLIDASKKGEGWIPPAIARIGTETAIVYLVSELKNLKTTQNQVGYAFKILGSKSIPYLVKELACSTNCDEGFYRAIVDVFHDLEGQTQSAIPDLIMIAENKEYKLAARQYAILCLGEIREPAFASVPILNELAESDPHNFKSIVGDALRKMGHVQGASFLVEKLNNEKNTFEKGLVLRDLAELGHSAMNAGSEIEKILLEQDDFKLKILAARTLGYIGYKEAIPTLMKSLEDQNYWDLVYVSAISLGQLHAKEALPQLRKIESGFWYPPVRKAASKAITMVERKEEYKSKYHKNNFPFEYFNYQHAGRNISPCDQVELIRKDDDKSKKLYGGIFSFFNLAPEISLKIDDGWVGGTNGGEWGGNLTYSGKNGKSYNILNENIHNLFHTNIGPIAVTGLAHMTINRGNIYTLTKNDKQPWKANEYLSLPGAPISSWKLESSEILINTYGGSVIFTKTGKLKMASCKT